MSAPDAPIRSRHADDPDFEERLERFMVELGERIDLIQEEERAGHMEGVAGRARGLAAEAGGLGFPVLAQAAGQVAAIADAGDGSELHKGIVELTDMVRRVRLGHRALP